MSKLSLRNIRVKVNVQGQPKHIFLYQSYRSVKILEHWHDTGCWWEGESEKCFYRLDCENLICEIYLDMSSQEWFIYKIYD